MHDDGDDAAEMTARHREALKVLAARALELACKVQERAIAAETDAGMAELSLAFHRVSRTFRQCLALEAKLVRDAEQAVRAARADAARDRGAEVKRRKQFLRTVLTRNIMDADDQCEDSDAGEAAVAGMSGIGAESPCDRRAHPPIVAPNLKLCCWRWLSVGHLSA